MSSDAHRQIYMQNFELTGLPFPYDHNAQHDWKIKH